jgi:hypothetical protein
MGGLARCVWSTRSTLFGFEIFKSSHTWDQLSLIFTMSESVLSVPKNYFSSHDVEPNEESNFARTDELTNSKCERATHKKLLCENWTLCWREAGPLKLLKYLFANNTKLDAAHHRNLNKVFMKIPLLSFWQSTNHFPLHFVSSFNFRCPFRTFFSLSFLSPPLRPIFIVFVLEKSGCLKTFSLCHQ